MRQVVPTCRKEGCTVSGFDQIVLHANRFTWKARALLSHAIEDSKTSC